MNVYAVLLSLHVVASSAPNQDIWTKPPVERSLYETVEHLFASYPEEEGSAK